MANVLVEETSLSNIASAIREKSGGSATYKPGEMAAAISNLPIGGSNNGEDAFLTRSGSGDYVNDRIETLGGGAFFLSNYSTITLSNVKIIQGSNAFYNNENLTTLNLPALTTIYNGRYTISQNDNLAALDLPALTTIKPWVTECFIRNRSLVSVNLPQLTNAPLNASFDTCTALEIVNLSNLQTLSNAYATFSNCPSLTTVDLPNLTKCDNLAYTFSNCTNLTTINMPNLIEGTVGSMAFSNCRALQTIELKISTSNYYNYMFSNCISLTKVKAPLATINATCFNKCSVLRTLILPQSNTAAVLESGTAFNDTLIGKNQNSGIYVPRVLLNEYKTATNWVTLSNYIYAIEDYPDITGG